MIRLLCAKSIAAFAVSREFTVINEIKFNGHFRKYLVFFTCISTDAKRSKTQKLRFFILSDLSFRGKR